MSAHALKALTRDKVGREIDQYVDALVERSGDTLDAMRLNQGIVQGMRTALKLQEDAYKEIGG